MIHPNVRAAPPIRDAATRALADLVDPRTARLRREELAWLAGQGVDPAAPGFVEKLLAVIGACRSQRSRILDRADTLRAAGRVDNPVARREVLARHLRTTVEDASVRRADLAALDRDLDLDAVLEREAAIVEQQGARIEVALELLARGGHSPGAREVLRELLAAERRPATRRAAARALALNVPAWDQRSLGVLRALVTDPHEDVWVRRRALDTCEHLPEDMRRDWLHAALDQRAVPDDALVRARAAELIARHCPVLFNEVARDPAEVVRAALIDGLRARGDTMGFGRLRAMMADEGAANRARVAEALRDFGAEGLGALARSLEDTELVASFACESALQLVLARHPLPADVRRVLDTLVATAQPDLARRAALVLCAADATTSPAWATASGLAPMRPGEEWTGPLPPGVDALDLARALSVFAADGFGFSIDRLRGGRVRVSRGDAPTPALWRVLHELRNPSPSKRQGHTHAVGRLDQGGIRVPPGHLAEESATGVPGQRVRIDREGGWAPAVPLVDDYLDATRRGRVEIVTPEGVTTIVAPAQAWRARIHLSLHYARYDALRGAALADVDPALRGRYVAAFTALGFTTTLGAGPDTTPPAGPSRAAFAAVSMVPLAWLVGSGSLGSFHLLVAVLVLALVLAGRSAVARQQVRRARRAIPLVIGGWGTRGKSGTERLKAAVLEGLGVPLLSKTTGCEAMVLHAPPGGHAMELFLFRPFDKATIWEQVNVVRLADRLGVRAFLWECMGLNPTYVNLLQAWWMRDDLSTLTNAYPDHEDIQGPTGLDVAATLGGFAPPEALLVCAEENMRPVLAEEAARRDCTLSPVPRAARELVPKELMDRMPHAEHPANVALAAEAMAALGVDRTEAIGLMADHVVPDLGALVVYPKARHLNRDVVFANGMSANDTLSFKHNWRRVGFATHDHRAKPDEWLVTVVNNRADRVARSRVFASILANDANAHRHVLIGTNLEGLRRYIEQAVEERLTGTVLDGAAERVDLLFAHLRLVDPVELGVRCATRLGGHPDLVADWRALELPTCAPTWDDATAQAERLRPLARALAESCDEPALADALVDASRRWCLWRAARSADADAVRAAYRALVRASIVLIEDSASSGDNTMATAISLVPPGATARIMGIQNIKGTGLDFAYQWVFWRELHTALGQLGDPTRRAAALDTIERNPLGSALACEAALEALQPHAGEHRVQLLLDHVRSRRDALLAARGKTRERKQGPVVRTIERIVDPLDSILRARRARQVFDDLATRRISHTRAQAELKRLTERQKGGWL